MATNKTAARPRCACVVIDVGNTSTSIGRWDGRRVTAVSAVRGGISASPEDVARALDRAGARTAGAAVLASVVPAVNAHWSWYLRRLYGLKLEILSHETPLPIDVDYPHPRQIGADRLCDAVGAAARHGFPVAVADFGTALTFDVVDARGAYVGGLIAPGLPVMGSYLHEKTAQLPAIDLRAGSPAWGDSTAHAMQLGARVAYRGMVREMADFIRRRTGEKTVFCATGGYAAWALEDSGIPCSVEPDLTLYGLGVIWSRSRIRTARPPRVPRG